MISFKFLACSFYWLFWHQHCAKRHQFHDFIDKDDTGKSLFCENCFKLILWLLSYVYISTIVYVQMPKCKYFRHFLRSFSENIKKQYNSTLNRLEKTDENWRVLYYHLYHPHSLLATFLMSIPLYIYVTEDTNLIMG